MAFVGIFVTRFCDTNGFLAFLALKVAFKVTYDLEFFELRENIRILNFVRTSGFWMFSRSWFFGLFGLFGLEIGLEGKL